MTHDIAFTSETMKLALELKEKYRNERNELTAQNKLLAEAVVDLERVAGIDNDGEAWSNGRQVAAKHAAAIALATQITGVQS